MKKCIAATLLTLVLAACQESATTIDRPTPCTEDWFVYVDEIVVTGDGAGHGPDRGSDEWRSTVEFKLGIRDAPEVPSRSSAAWCDFIDQRVAPHEM